MKKSILSTIFGSNEAEQPIFHDLKTDFKPIKPARDILDFTYPPDSPYAKSAEIVRPETGPDIIQT